MKTGRIPDPNRKASGTCPTCQKVHTFYKSQPRIYCSAACKRTDPAIHVETACPECGETFRYRKSWPRKYCSLSCSGKANHSRQFPNFQPTGYDAKCEQCGTEIRVTRATRGRFCSLRCFGDWQSEHVRGEAHPKFGKPQPRPNSGATLTCPECGAVFPIKPHQANRRRYCSKACQGKAFSRDRSGANSPFWKGGIEPYYGPSWRPAMRAVRKRDKVCQDCGKTPEDEGKALDVHHVMPFRRFGVERHEEANALTNLIALCNRCHLLRDWADGNRGKAQDATPPEPLAQ